MNRTELLRHAKDMKMPTLGQMFPSQFLKAADIGDEDLVLTVSDIKQELLGQGADADSKWVLKFHETEKGLVLNVTNSNTIAKLYGPDTDDWEGKKIALFSTEVDFQGKQTLAIRVRMKAPKSKPAAAPATAPTATPTRSGAKPLTQAEADAAGDGDEEIPF